MEKKNKVSTLLMILGVICIIVGAVMGASSIYDVRSVFWIPIAIGILPLGIGIKKWLDN